MLLSQFTPFFWGVQEEARGAQQKATSDTTQHRQESCHPARADASIGFEKENP